VTTCEEAESKSPVRVLHVPDRVLKVPVRVRAIRAGAVRESSAIVASSGSTARPWAFNRGRRFPELLDCPKVSPMVSDAELYLKCTPDRLTTQRCTYKPVS
jgi:hypothetical protein